MTNQMDTFQEIDSFIASVAQSVERAGEIREAGVQDPAEAPILLDNSDFAGWVNGHQPKAEFITETRERDGQGRNWRTVDVYHEIRAVDNDSSQQTGVLHRSTRMFSSGGSSRIIEKTVKRGQTCCEKGTCGASKVFRKQEREIEKVAKRVAAEVEREFIGRRGKNKLVKRGAHLDAMLRKQAAGEDPKIGPMF